MRVVNIVDSLDHLNYGVWNAAVVNAALLSGEGYETELWFPGKQNVEIKKVTFVPIRGRSIAELERLIIERKLNPQLDVVVTHGIWHFSTKWGHHLNRNGFRWIYVPQGMLEPWPLRQKWLKKKIYFLFVEKHLAENANIIRAVSKPELNNLKRQFQRKRIEFLPNAVDVKSLNNIVPFSEKNEIKRYLFLSRLHHKKNIIVLANAWASSTLNNNSRFEFVIAGPDQGELEQLDKIIQSSSNMTYVGAVFGEEKKALLHRSTFYVLPSFSEGLPSALLEAMSCGLIPIITEGCNFPDVFENELGVKVSTEMSSIIEALEQTSTWDTATINDKSERGRALIAEQYSLEAITKKQIELYFGPQKSI